MARRVKKARRVFPEPTGRGGLWQGTPTSSIFATSKVTWRFMGGSGSCEGANRIDTTLDVGFNSKPLHLESGRESHRSDLQGKVN